MTKLHSLVDLLKKNLYFAEGLTVIELTRYIQQKMLQDYTFQQAQSFVNSCLHQCACFNSSDGYIWYMDKQGLRENDQFFNMLFKHQRPLKFSSTNTVKKGRKNTKIVSHPTNLNSDGRFIQLEGGNWGLTDWEVDVNDYRLRHVIIKVLYKNTNGLTYDEIQDKVEIWKKACPYAVRDLLHKYPYFRKQDDKWLYFTEARSAYEKTLEKYLKTLHRQQLKHLSQKHKLSERIKTQELQFREIYTAKKQIAASLAEKNQNMEDYDHLIQRFAEKDLLLSLRKRELYRVKEEKQKAEKKADSILYQCRLWMNKAKLREQENENLTQDIIKLKGELAELTERERQQRYIFAQQKDKSATEKAEVIRENVNLKHQLEKIMTKSKKEEKELKNEIGRLTAELRRIIQENEERRYSMEMLELEFHDLRKENRILKASTKHPLVRFSLKIAAFFGR
ncbi:hypothetical protein [Desulfitibacter alkalitolerans]|uniref:hypothetical protein n=1 Tax=Desulfitibacter alkalitolerans TaxID=264641 RepID=UPI0004862A19|nr:hypothetical protein [Desulfitibacter alkalitolerans]